MPTSRDIYFLSFERSELDGKYALIVCVCCYAGHVCMQTAVCVGQ